MNLKFITLIHKNWTGQSTIDEDQQLQDWEQDKAVHQAYADDLSSIWKASAEQIPSFQPDVEASLARFKARINQEEINQTPAHTLSDDSSNRWMRIAAAVLIIVVAGFVGNKMMASDEEMLFVQTTSEETKSIQLVDGSEITLNEESSLSYPAHFKGDIRQVELNGEAFFDIERKPDQPFTILTTHTQITVLGTSFNVRSELDESTTAVNVATGKVQLTSKKTNESIILTKGDEGVYNHRSQILNTSTYPSTNAASWLDGRLTFNKTPLTVVVQDLEYYFDVDIDIENTQLEQCKYTSLFNTPKLMDILELLTTAFDMELEQTQKNSYLLKGGQCK